MESDRRRSNRRRHPRYGHSGKALIGPSRTGVTIPGFIINLSLGGCLLRLPEETGLMRDAMVEVSLQSNFLAFRAIGSVRNDESESGLFGIEFVSLSRRGLEDLTELIAHLEGRDGANSVTASVSGWIVGGQRSGR